MSAGTTTHATTDNTLAHCPFLVLVDSQEKAPWSFANIRARSFIDGKRRMYAEIPTTTVYLGVGQGDYSIDGFRGRVSIERKSLEDCHGTLLGWKQRRDRFQRELSNLADMDAAAVVVEASLGQVLAAAPTWGEKTAAENRNALLGTIIAWQQRYRVPWVFCDDRRLAEIAAFRILEQFWHEHKHK